MIENVGDIYAPAPPRPLGVGDVVQYRGSGSTYLLVQTGDNMVMAIRLHGDFSRWSDPIVVKDVHRLDKNDVWALFGNRWQDFERLGRSGADLSVGA